MKTINKTKKNVSKNDDVVDVGESGIAPRVQDDLPGGAHQANHDPSIVKKLRIRIQQFLSLWIHVRLFHRNESEFLKILFQNFCQ